MNTTRFFPLRSTVGRSIPIKEIKPLFCSAAFEQWMPDLKLFLKNNLQETVTDSRYASFFPDLTIGSGRMAHRIVPADGADVLPLPGPNLLPIEDGPLWSISALTGQPWNAHDDFSRKLSVTLELIIDDAARFGDSAGVPLIGGLCYGGYPYLPYCINDAGENTANFGLPREISLTTPGEQPDQPLFIDADYTTTKQEIISHSGFHFLTIDPVRANRLILKLAGFPRILQQARLARAAGGKYQVRAFEEVYGFIIPYLTLFEYKEQTRYRPVVPAGVLASFQEPVTSKFEVRNRSGYSRFYFDSEFECEGTNSAGQPSYALFTASLVDSQERTYGFGGAARHPIPGAPSTALREYYISDPVPPKGSVRLYFEQGEESERCLAGIKLFAPLVPAVLPSDAGQIQALSEYLSSGNSANTLDSFLTSSASLTQGLIQLLGIPKVSFCQELLLRVYEIDPVEGVSPVAVPLTSKYATPIAEQPISTRAQDLAAFFRNGIRFVRPSSSRYFAVTLTNTGKQKGQFVVGLLDFIQSANVSISTRAAKTRSVVNLHYRLIGPDLAHDYCRFGPDGFSMSVERWVAGSRKSVLFSARTLLDLLESGTARIYANQRRRAVELEQAVSIGGPERNYENRRSRVKGWRSGETGDGLEWDESFGAPPAGSAGFVNVGNSENRTHTHYLFPDGKLSPSDVWTASSGILNLMEGGAEANGDVAAFIQSLVNQNPPSNPLTPASVAAALGSNIPIEYPMGHSNEPVFSDGAASQFWAGNWKGIDTSKLHVHGLKNFSQSPFGLAAMAKDDYGVCVAFVQAITELITAVTQGPVPSNAPSFMSQGDWDTLLGVFGILPGTVAAPSMIPPLLWKVIDYAASLLPAATTGLFTATVLLPVMAGLSFSGSLAPFGAGFSMNGSPCMPNVMLNTTSGTQGTIVRQASSTGYSFSQLLNRSFDDVHSTVEKGETNRRVARRVSEDFPTERIKGAEVMWQGEIVDIITGTIPLQLTLPASAGKMYRTTDDSLRVRLGSGVGTSLSVDIWFDMIEEFIKDDY